MAYTALARRYRSRDFDEVVGQEPIARTLRNAIDSGRVSHAYLFTGTRGVGKTSMARIFAKALNSSGEAGPVSDEVAQAIMSGQDSDVIEIDAASNRRVEETRELIANCIYRPMRGPYKVYIIDEVHMLTREAFNTLLKTMEEPPEHVKFILCTTEADKVPPTIRSRCQRFDFRNIPTREIARHLAEIVEKEGLKAEPDLVHQVARLGDGSMRDALSLMDRLMAAGEKTLTLDLLERLLGLPARDTVSALIDAVAAGDPKAALEAADNLLSRGNSPEQITETLASRFRDLMVIAACGPETDLVDLAGDSRAEETQRATGFDAAGLMHLVALCESVQRHIKSSASPRALLDAAVVRLAMSERIADVAAIAAGHAQQPSGAPRAQPSGAPRAQPSGVPSKK